MGRRPGSRRGSLGERCGAPVTQQVVGTLAVGHLVRSRSAARARVPGTGGPEVGGFGGGEVRSREG